MKSCTLETGISDYHKLIMSTCRMTFAKGKLFQEILIKNFSEMEVFLKSFETTFSLTFEKFAPLKQKYLRYNNTPFMNRTLRKAIMTRFKLKRGTT